MSLIVQAQERNTPEAQQFKLHSSSIALKGHEGAVLSCKFSPDGHNIATSGLDRHILLWSLPTNEEQAPNYGVLQGHKAAVTSVTWKLQNTLFSTSADSTVAFWDAETGQKTRKGLGHELTVNDSAANDSGAYISVGDDGTLRLWDERERNAVRIVNTSNPLISCAINRDASIAYVSGIDSAVQAFDLSSGELMWRHDDQNDGVTGLDLSADESMVVIKAMDGSVITSSAKSFIPDGLSRNGLKYDGATGDVTQYASKVRFSKDDVYIGSGSDDGSLILWSSATQRMVSKFPGHIKPVVDLDFHPYSNLILSCSSGGDVIVREY